MKVKIITRHAVANYGSILQAFATQKAVEKLGYESEIINYVRYDEQGKNISNTMLRRNKKWNKNFITRFIYRLLQTPVYNGSYKKFAKFRKDFLKESNVLYSCDEDLKKLPEADVYCTGSDQVWGKIGNVEYDKNYFLNFVPKNKKCISYASSFGKSKISDELIKNLPVLLEKYSHITVREDSAVELLKKMNINSQQVLDPTLLLSRSEWEEVIKNNLNCKDYVLIYQLHEDKKLEKYAEEFAKKVNKPLIRISISLLYKLKSGKLAYLPTPNEFLEYFKNCEYVITDSFHATVFSIIFNKKFVDILPSGTGTRIVSLLKLLGLEKRIVSDYNDFSLIGKEIEYNDVNKKLDIEREKSISILNQIIKD